MNNECFGCALQLLRNRDIWSSFQVSVVFGLRLVQRGKTRWFLKEQVTSQQCICSQSSNHDPANHVVLQLDDSASKVKSNVRRRQVEIMEQLMFLEGLEDYGVGMFDCLF